MSDTYLLNPDHTYRPCSLMEWAGQFEKIESVAKSEINDNRISTVWLGLDHNYFGGPPLVFETMVFDKDGKDIYMDRYTTWQEAEEGHQRAVEWVKNGCNEDER